MTFDNDEEERKHAMSVVFRGIPDEGFQKALQLKCRHEIAKAAPPGAIDAVLDMEDIPPPWAHWVIYYHRRLLDDARVQQLINTIATDVEVSYWTLSQCAPWLTDKQCQQLLDKVTTSAKRSYYILCERLPNGLTKAQIQQCINAIVLNAEWSHDTFRDLSKRLTGEQVQRLIDQIATNEFCSRITLRYCSDSLTDTQRQQLKSACPSKD